LLIELTILYFLLADEGFQFDTDIIDIIFGSPGFKDGFEQFSKFAFGIFESFSELSYSLFG
jgi:hypothetical protein